MRHQTRLHMFSLSLLLTFLMGGCASGPKFVPDELKNSPISDLVILKINIQNIRSIKIDSNDIGRTNENTIVYLSPGHHKIEYQIFQETELWGNLKKSMKEKGYVLARDGKTFVYQTGLEKSSKSGNAASYFHEAEMSRHPTIRPLGIEKYYWKSKEKEFIGKSAGVYYLSEL